MSLLIRRVEASITTAFVSIVLVIVLAWAARTVMPIEQYLMRGGFSARSADVLAGCLMLLVPVLWVLVDAAAHKATYGMRRRNLGFVSGEETDISTSRCFLRVLLGIVCIPLLPATVVVALADRKHRTIADLICATAVRRTDMVDGQLL